MRTRLLSVLIPLVLAAPAAAQGATTPYRSEAGFALDLPTGWVRAADRAVDDLRNASPASPGLTYEAVFQVARARWPSPPFAAIARGVAPDWLTPEEFRRRFTADDAQARIQRQTDQGDTLRVVRLRAHVGAPRYDAATRAAWVRAESGSSGFVWTVLMLHPSGGSLIMLLYQGDAGTDEEQALRQMESVVRSLRVD
jgi:hypothetical protein